MSMSTLPFGLALDFLKLVDLVGHQARFFYFKVRKVGAKFAEKRKDYGFSFQFSVGEQKSVRY